MVLFADQQTVISFLHCLIETDMKRPRGTELRTNLRRFRLMWHRIYICVQQKTVKQNRNSSILL